MSEQNGTQPCGCDPAAHYNCQYFPSCAWGKYMLAGSPDGFCPCTEGAPCPKHVTPTSVPTEEFCLGCGKATATSDCGCPCGTGWRTIVQPKTTVYTPLPQTLVIGLGHKARHGKDTTAQILVELFPQSVKRFALADALRCYCRVEHGMTVKDAPLLQKVGVEMRERNPSIWIDTLYWQLVENAPRIAVITDVRFNNEANFVRQMGGMMVRVQRISPTTGEPFQATDRDPNHVSETELDSYLWDTTIVASSPKELRMAVANYFYPKLNTFIG